MQTETIEHPFNRTPSRLIRAHAAITECLRIRDYHSLKVWAADAEKMELSLNDDAAISNDKGCIGYVFNGYRYTRIYEQDII